MVIDRFLLLLSALESLAGADAAVAEGSLAAEGTLEPNGSLPPEVALVAGGTLEPNESLTPGGALPLLLSQELLLCPVPLHLPHLMIVPTLDILVAFGFSCASLVLCVLGRPGILMYPGALSFGLSEVGQLS